ncbi:MAG: hypothetical protein P4L50_18515 [Anaerolineaceae bacterium]|nr:hypothetical protein [Anaerolineaceae bacterium]
MFRRRIAAISLVFILFISISCSFSGASAPANPTPDIQGTQTQAMADRLATSAYWATVDVKDQAQAVQNANATITAQAQKANATLSYRTRGTATAEFLASSTLQASTIQRSVQNLILKGILTSNQGTFAGLPNFDQSLASINSSEMFPSQYAPSNFVLRANTFWDAASTSTNWFASGCGITFHITNNNQDYYAVRLTLDGHADLLSYSKGVMSDIYKNFYGYLSTPSGGAQIMLVVNNGWITFYVNEKQALRIQANVHPSGQLGTAVYSGTNQGFGVRCQMTSIELWQLQ